MTEAIGAELTDEGLLLYDGDVRHVFHPLWLRESSSDPDFRDEGTGLRIGQATELPLKIAVTQYDIDAETLSVTFSDGHLCQFNIRALMRQAASPRPADLVGKPEYWDASFDGYPVYPFDELKNDEACVLDALNTVARSGFAVVHDMPVHVDALASFAALIGPVRETNWGRITDVRNIENPYDLTMTARSLSPHVDNPYRLPGPGYIFMHCLANEAAGGESTMVDGFGAAAALREQAPDAFDVLTSVAPNFRHAEADAVLEHSGPLIELNAAGEIARVRFSNRTEQIPPLAPATLDRYYAARKQFAALVFAPERTLKLKLRPGDGFIWDNYRILHGRTAFDGNGGNRHMRHCYMDRDTVSSRHKCLLRQFQTGDTVG